MKSDWNKGKVMKKDPTILRHLVIVEKHFHLQCGGLDQGLALLLSLSTVRNGNH
jgi:hypothetical protein